VTQGREEERTDGDKARGSERNAKGEHVVVAEHQECGGDQDANLQAACDGVKA
jgi:hypothetical protein